MFTVDLSSLNMKETDLNIPTTTFSVKVDIIEEEEADSHDQVEPVTTLHLKQISHASTRVIIQDKITHIYRQFSGAIISSQGKERL